LEPGTEYIDSFHDNIAMRMSECEAGVPAPLITADLLVDHVKRSVMFIGKVTAISGNILTLDGCFANAAPVKVTCRQPPTMLQIAPDMILLVRGFVNDDGSISECDGYSPTILGDNFDLQAANLSVAVTNNPAYRSMFC